MRYLLFILPVILLAVFAPYLQARIIRVPTQQPHIQGGIDACSNGDTVLVLDGTYTGEGNRDIDFRGKAILVMSENGNGTAIIDCQNGGRGFNFHNNETNSSVLRGFTIRHGRAGGGIGGAIRIISADPTIEDCVFSDNYATFYGGAIHVQNSDGTRIIRCEFYGNRSGSVGGGIRVTNSNPLISDCIFMNNTAVNGGGAIQCVSDSDAEIINCVISNNNGNFSGGGLLIGDHSSPSITGCLISENVADDGAGIMTRGPSRPIFANCTIVDNQSASSLGGGITIDDGASATFTNSILWNNEPGEINIIDGSLDITYSDIEGGWQGGGNIEVDPRFRDPANSDFHLMSTTCGYLFDSPCIDAGYPGIADLTLDCSHGLGETRSDMGAYGGQSGGPVSIGDNGFRSETQMPPNALMLSQNYPNPFNPSTTIGYSIPGGEAVHVDLRIYDLRGQSVRSLVVGEKEPGEHSVHWNGKNDRGESVESGIYLYRLEAGKERFTRKMTVWK